MRTVEWINGRVRMIDQRQLPWNFTHLDFEDYREVAQAITDMVVRGAPAIGATGAFGMALAAYQCPTQVLGDALDYLEVAAIILKKSRPTAVNLAWGVDRMMQVAREDVYRNTKDMLSAMIKEAQTIADQDVVINQLMGKHGAALIRDGDVVIHHCNTGALATVDYGTALGVIRTAWEQKKKFRVLLTETRPRMQGARLSAWELHQLGVPFEIIPDSSAGYYMRRGEAKLVLVGADRVAANGDTINKIGTYMLSVLAKENNIPFYTVAPTSTIDLDMPTGDQVPIEERSADEVRTPYGNALIPEEYPVRNPAFDVTPQRYLAGIVTEHGIALPPFKESLARMVAANSTAKVG